MSSGLCGSFLSAKVFKSSCMPIIPVFLILFQLGFRIKVITGWQCGHKDRNLDDLTSLWINHLHLQSSIVHLHFFAPLMLFMHTGFYLLFFPSLEMFAKLGVLISVWMLLFVFQLQQSQGDSLLPFLGIHLYPVWHENL